MRRLIVNPGTEMAWEIPLPGGTVQIGREEGNTAVIDDPSISGTHCEILVSDEAVRLRDAGSANGIYVDGELVNELELQPGQVFQLGEVNLRYEFVSTPVIQAGPRIRVAELKCKVHARSFARFFCPQCQQPFCELCVTSRLLHGRPATLCRVCQTECAPVERPEVETVPEASLFKQMLGAFSYPFRGDGVYVLVLGAIMFALISGALWLMRFGMVYGLVGFSFLSVFSGGYLAAYMKSIIMETSRGDDQPPDWPEISDFANDVRGPFFQMLGTTLLCFLPAIGMYIYIQVNGQASEDTQWYGWCLIGFILLGSFYFPMAFTGVAMFDSVAAVNPLLIVPSILRIFKAYVLAVVLLAVIVTFRWMTGTFLKSIIPMPVLPDLIMSFVGLYLVMVEMRVLGLMYRAKKEELGWFNN